MEEMIKQQFFALDMETLSLRIQQLQLEEKLAILLNELWNQPYPDEWWNLHVNMKEWNLQLKN